MRAILFDLDGTLTASGPGIIKSVQYALAKMGCPEADAEKLRFFIGPPLIDSMRRFRPFSQQEAERAVDLYHEYYCRQGLFDNQVYPGIDHLLRALQKTNCALAVASSKPEKLVRQILDHYQLSRYFDQIVGASTDGKRSGKASVIEEALRRLEMSNSREQVLMVGDTASDVNGAKEARVDCMAVSYGYGTHEELEAAGAQEIVDDIATLEGKLLKFSTAALA